MDLFRVSLPRSADGMQVAGKDIDLVPPPSSVACVKALAHSLLQSARNAFYANYSNFCFVLFLTRQPPSGPKTPYLRVF